MNNHPLAYFVFVVYLSLGCSNNPKLLSDNEKEKNVHQKIENKANSKKTTPLTEEEKEKLVNEIRENFNQINKIKKWSSIKNVELWDTAEGGEAKLYINTGEVRKIVIRRYGETFQSLQEYYLLDSKLSFVYEKIEKYNRPIYQDKKSMIEIGDNEMFDQKKSKFFESRKYFYNGNIIKRLNSRGHENPFDETTIIEDEKELLKDLNELLSSKKEHENRSN